MAKAAKKRKSNAAKRSKEIDQQLSRYRAMRNFGVTAEPRGKPKTRAAEPQLPFVVQKHAATQLHYDFRLGWRNVLKSWAVTKGPSYNPADKRLAVQVEDHPIEYGGFEGIIPQGQYGGGTVLLWDQGTWTPHNDVDEGLKRGHLKFALHGKKLDGDWVLVRMGGKAAVGPKSNWLLIKERDGRERGPDDPCVTEEEPNSVVTGRSLEEIAESQDHVWNSEEDGTAKGGQAPFPILLTHPDKEVDKETGLTKRKLADYFWAVRDAILPHIANRPLSIVRCPQGSTKPCFFQKHVTDTVTEGIEGIEIQGRRSGVLEKYITISTPLGLAGLAQMGVIEIHPWGSSNSDIEKPDRLVLDLDPDTAIEWSTLAESAREVRARLKKLKLESFLKMTGGKGLHVVAPIEPKYDWPVVKEFAHAFALQMERENPRLYSTKMTKAVRTGKIFLDYLRNERGSTSIAPYSPRARAGAPVAMPMSWKELDEAKPPRFTVAEFSEWKARLRHDPWKAMLKMRQSIPVGR